MMSKGIALLGASGSIGKNTLEVLRKHKDKFSLVAFSVHENLDVYYSIIEEFRPRVAVITGSKRVENPPIPTLYGKEGLIEISSREDIDVIVVATSGNIGVYPTLQGLRNGKRIALANKETLVAFGEVVMSEVRKRGGELVPIDSEHSALFQLFQKYKDEISELYLTASGGPFRSLSREEMKKVHRDQVLNHPVWKMGPKITVDSATLMNKGLEVIEAYWLFGLPARKIRVLIHPQSIVHGLLKLKDGAYVAHLSFPDMKIPIQYALTYPDRAPWEFAPLDLVDKSLEFYGPDLGRFPLLKLAYDVLEEGGIKPCIMNAANDIAVAAFLKGQIGFLDIEKVVFETVSKFGNVSEISLDVLEHFDTEARIKAKEIVEDLSH
ncbi:MAG: 1-deoxy-D-xylulose-5-phosphate reductoisomerase [candidate division WOR-3 bacterium]